MFFLILVSYSVLLRRAFALLVNLLIDYCNKLTFSPKG
nr:MAG TPA: hypothetical protein [Caudoviricetes sp.]